jgi:hypothetical protein
MIKRKANVYLSHTIAMQMILLMESNDALKKYPNIAFVKATKFSDLPTAPQVKANPALDPAGSLDMHIKYLRDMLRYVEPEVYTAFQEALRDGLLDATDLSNTFSDLSKVMIAITETKLKLQFWDGEFPHGCYLIMREFVPILLENRLTPLP